MSSVPRTLGIFIGVAILNSEGGGRGGGVGYGRGGVDGCGIPAVP